MVGYCLGGLIAHGIAARFEGQGRPYTLTLIDPAPNLDVEVLVDATTHRQSPGFLRMRSQLFDYFLSKFGNIQSGLNQRIDKLTNEWLLDTAMLKTSLYDEAGANTLRNIANFFQAPHRMDEHPPKLNCTEARIFLCSSGMKAFQSDGEGLYRFKDGGDKYGPDGVYGWSSLVSGYSVAKLPGHHLLIGAHVSKAVPYLKQLAGEDGARLVSINPERVGPSLPCVFVPTSYSMKRRSQPHSRSSWARTPAPTPTPQQPCSFCRCSGPNHLER